MISLIFIHYVFIISVTQVDILSAENYDPCCSFPCQNFGVCDRIGFTDKYVCDCHRTGHYGENCEKAYFSKWLKDLLRPSTETILYLTTNGKLFWDIVNSIEFLHNFVLKKVIELRSFLPPWPEPNSVAADYTTWDGYANKTYYGRTLPPVPKNCPTPMGITGPKVLPDAELLIEEVFTRTKFKPCPHGTSVLLPLFGQHFTHQAFKSYSGDKSLTWGKHEMDGSHLYGETIEKQRLLRTMESGKMKMQVINGEEYPPKLKDCGRGLGMNYPSNIDEKYQVGLGHPFFALLPFLLYWSTLFLREHNRLCDILQEMHPDWDDERLYQTARLNIIAQVLEIAVGDYAQQVSATYLNLEYKPELLHDSQMRWSSGRIHVEFNTMYHWHSTVPDFFTIAGKNYTLEGCISNARPLVDHGMEAFTISLSKTPSGRGPGGRNMHKFLHKVVEKTLKMNRRIRLQSFNRYRMYSGMKPLKSFEELTGEKRLSKLLSDMYGGDIDSLEYLIGILVEQRYPTAMWGITAVNTIARYAFRNVFSNTIGSPEFWKPSTFGGEKVFEITKSTTLQSLVCRNVQGCPKISFQIPDEDIPPDEGMVYDDVIVKSSKNKNEL